MNQRKLLTLNLFRWIREYIIAWGLLSLIYSYTLTLLLQPMLEAAFKREIPVPPLWITTCAALILPAILEALPYGHKRLVRRGFFGERIWRVLAGGLGPLYLRHDLRRGATWFTVALSVGLAGVLPEKQQALWILVAQLPVQRALYSVHRWRTLALNFHPSSGAPYLIGSVWLSQSIQYLVGWLALGAMQILQTQEWISLGLAGFAAVLSAATTAMEGDSGRPWIVNFVALAAGIIGGFLTLFSPWAFLVVVYFCMQTRKTVLERLKSVEHLDEDTVIS